MAPSSLLDTIELFDHIGAHYALPRLDRAAPAPVLAGAISHVFALVENAFNDAARVLDVDLTRRTRKEAAEIEIVGDEAMEKEKPPRPPVHRRVFVPRYDYGDLSPLSSPPPATPLDSPLASRAPAGKMVETYASHAYIWPQHSSSSSAGFGLSSVDWDDGDTDYDSDMESYAPARPTIMLNRALSVMNAPYMVPQPSGTSSRPPPARFLSPQPRRASAPSSASVSSRSFAASPSAASSASTSTPNPPSSSSAPRKRPRPRPLAQRHSAPSALSTTTASEPRRAARASKTNAQASWSWLVSKRRKTDPSSTAGAEAEDAR